MKNLLVFVVVLGGTICEGMTRPQIWSEPNYPGHIWGLNSPPNPNEYHNRYFWTGPARLDQPPRNPAAFLNGFTSDSRNQNTRATTEDLGPITSTPRTVHTAPRGCKCPMTQQFNPVCGTDGNTYRNRGLLNCYVRCGKNVSQKRLGTC